MTAAAPGLQPWWVSARSIRDDAAECLIVATPTRPCECSSTTSTAARKKPTTPAHQSPGTGHRDHDRLFGGSAIGYLPENEVRYAAELVLARIQQSWAAFSTT